MQIDGVRWSSQISLQHDSRITGVYRLGDGLACTLSLERRDGVWEMAAVHVHPTRDAVAIGPLDEELTSDHEDLADEDLVVVDRSQTTFELAKEAASETPVPVTTRVLRELPLGQLAEDLRQRVYRRLKAAYKAEMPVAGRDDSEVQRKRKQSEWVSYLEGEWTRPGRQGHPDVFYAGVASEYVQRLAMGRRSPVRDIAKARQYSTSMVNNWVHTARKRGLLTASPPGRAGGDLTDRARQLLAGEHEEL